MTLNERSGLTRRHWLAGMAAGSAAFKFLEAGASAQTGQNRPVNRYSAPSQLKITDMRACTIAGVTGLDYPIIRIDTNQGVYGLGEVRDGGVAGWALVLKPHLVGKNPLDIEPLLDNLRQFANHRRGGGGYSAVDTALHDIAGKVYGVPCWRLLGSKYRDRVRIYCHFPQAQDPKKFAEGVRLRKEQGFTFYKMDDLSAARLLNGVPGAVQSNGVATDKGIKLMCDRIELVRQIVGWEAPLAADRAALGWLSLEQRGGGPVPAWGIPSHHAQGRERRHLGRVRGRRFRRSGPARWPSGEIHAGGARDEGNLTGFPPSDRLSSAAGEHPESGQVYAVDFGRHAPRHAQDCAAAGR